MSAKHTPGPWRLNADNSTEVMTVTGFNVARAHCNGIYHIKLAQAEANACLIAAAPDLLAALQDLVSDDGPNPGAYFSQRIAAARAAIAKATQP
jgi:hypothetical protein